MNKKGFTLVELLATIIVVALIMALILPSAMRVHDENKDKLYESFQKMMEEYAAISPLKSNNRINLEDLNTSGDLDAIEKEGCDGYVIINHSATPITYKAYISCDSGYSTP